MARRRGSDYWPEYVSVAQRKAKAASKAKEMKKKGVELFPVTTSPGRNVAKTFWGQAWCKHLESFSDYSNRLPRGRSYARNGSVIHLAIQPGHIEALVSGSSTYKISISVKPLSKKKWQSLKDSCAGGIGSVLELLQGKISDNVMVAVCDRDNGLFPSPQEIQLDCNCPDWAALCKHLAAVMYGVGVRLDESPELLFLLRGVDYQELIGAELAIDTTSDTDNELSGPLGDIFGIQIDDNMAALDAAKAKPAKNTLSKPKRKKAASKKTTVKTKAKAASKTGTKVKKGSAAKTSSGIDISRGIRASHLKKLRKANQLNEIDLAELTNKSVATIRKWEASNGILVLQRASQQSLEAVFAMTNADMMDKLGISTANFSLRK